MKPLRMKTFVAALFAATLIGATAAAVMPADAATGVVIKVGTTHHHREHYCRTWSWRNHHHDHYCRTWGWR